MRSISLKAFIFGIVSASFLVFGVAGFMLQDQLSQPILMSAGRFKIEKGQPLKDVAFNLQKQGIIDDPLLFMWYGEFTGRDKSIKAGTYELKSSLRIKELFTLFGQGSNIRVKVVLPPGITMANAIERMKKAGLSVDPSYLQNPPSELKNKYTFLKDLPAGASLEGFLFPDTYIFSPEDSTQQVVDALLANFQKKFDPEWYAAAQAQGKTVHEMVIMASIVEKEVRTLQEKKIASGILWKRIAVGMPLQVDSSVNYATGKSLPAVTLEDLAIESPYNTYKHTGLPPGPIANPGLTSLQAALFPEPSQYWFYLSRQDTGETIFSQTFAQHSQAKAKYLR